MPIPAQLAERLALPVIGAPMCIVSNSDLVIAQCKGGIIGAFPALNARPKEELSVLLDRIQSPIAEDPSAAHFVVNQNLKASIEAAGLDPASLPDRERSAMNFDGGVAKAWRDIWGADQGVGGIADVPGTADLVARLKKEYAAAKAALPINGFEKPKRMHP